MSKGQNTSTGKLGREEIIVIATYASFPETEGNAIATFYLVPQLSKPRGFNL
ncbi:MAG TPA: hypothetical protein VH330_07120 [Candidatus Udaeobacter sp.]